MQMTRRQTLGALTGLGATLLLAPQPGAMAADPQVLDGGARTDAGGHSVQPLPFDPKKLAGLSERLLVSHHDNNYAGAVRNLNQVELQLASVTKDTPGFLVAGLRERELTFTNSVLLHELYFANLGGKGAPAGAIATALASAFGSGARFEELFRATAMSLAGGSGWVVLDLSLQSQDLRIHGSGGHSQAPAFAAPLLVLDMYEHSYHLDYGAAAAKYVDAFFANLRWEEVARRHERARKAARALAV